MLDESLFSEKFNHAFSLVLNVTVLFSAFFSLVLVTAPRQYDLYRDKSLRFLDSEGKEIKMKTKDGRDALQWRQGRTIQIVVLGDLGRSPRMQYHALSIAKHGARVFLIGYQESEMHPDITANPLIKIVPLLPIPSFLRSSNVLLFPLLAPLRVLWQVVTLYLALGYRCEPARWLLVQNPPSIPTLVIARVMCFLRNTDLVIDWHNFAYSILALKLGQSHPFVAISAMYERVLARTATHNLTVSNAMARVLQAEYGVAAQALHDRPMSIFRPITAEQRSIFLAECPDTAPYAQDLSPCSPTPWKLIVSSTSWTADEDFSLLLDALVAYSVQACSQTHLPKILAVITGKGPQKEHYLKKIRALGQENKLEKVVVTTAWLTPEDYALLLGAADLGVSLHTSSSGVDLPMKVVDMFGAGLPVVGWGEFEAWPELVKQGVNGLGFGGAEQLAEQLMQLFGRESGMLDTLKQGALTESQLRWDQEWDRVGGTLFKLT